VNNAGRLDIHKVWARLETDTVPSIFMEDKEGRQKAKKMPSF
jgi:hypothetical protein